MSEPKKSDYTQGRETIHAMAALITELEQTKKYVMECEARTAQFLRWA